MIRKTNALITVLIIVLFSCGDKHDFEVYLKDIGIELIDEYKINFIEQSGFNDWELKSSIIISDNDKLRILEKLRKENKFERVASKDVYFKSHINPEDSLSSFIILSNYFYIIEKGRYENINDDYQRVGYIIYELEIDTINNKLCFLYTYE